MRFPVLRMALAAFAVLAFAVGCRKPKAIQPRKPVPQGTVQFQFTTKVEGPIDLTIDGVRIPVAKTAKKGRHLTISGLALGRHRLVLLSPLDAFGPDQVEVELKEGKGHFQVLFAQQFNAVLYGKPEPTPVAEGIPGVVARLEP
ncbi:hypothetical protein [Mesoterricola sediminis]|uniref:PEGA domain-containing protein n=1 Tax=Mesoterricola sediminis TaxID=2927980 RepID=A0AA48GP84_9BACT|nr:hypothetical protein [Mesoterricola sediminis]BDU76736.1 hypothetical protein METESE_16940 [Mesoterricola sediminis]